MSWAEIKKSLNSDPRTPLDVLLRSILSPMETNVNKIGNSTYGLEALKTLIEKYRSWYPSYGTSATLKSTTTVTKIVSADNYQYDDDYTTIFTFVAPKTGHYRLDVAGKVTSTHSDAQDVYLQTCLGIKRGTTKSMCTNDSVGLGWDYITGDSKSVSPNVETTLTGITADLFLEEGVSYYIGVGARAGYVTKASAYVTSASIKYVKNAGITY